MAPCSLKQTSLRTQYFERKHYEYRTDWRLWFYWFCSPSRALATRTSGHRISQYTRKLAAHPQLRATKTDARSLSFRKVTAWLRCHHLRLWSFAEQHMLDYYVAGMRKSLPLQRCKCHTFVWRSVVPALWTWRLAYSCSTRPVP